LELEVSDDTAQAVVVMFDETARIVVKCSAGSIVGSEEQDEEETGLPPTVVLEEALDESGSSETLAAAGGPKTGVFVPLTTTPSVTTPSKPGEQKQPRNEERDDSDGEESFVADSKTKGSNVGCSFKGGKGECWCWIARNEYHKFGQYGSVIKEADRVPNTAKFNVVRVLNQ
ncbi:hypothetical protein Tco_1485884, partial [Tanacetum coccineum]